MTAAKTIEVPEKTVFVRALQAVASAAVIGATAVTFALSFAAIIYTGPLLPYLSQGIGLALIGAVIMAVIGSATLSYRGTLVQPQDVSAILLSLCAAAIVARPGLDAGAAFSTVVVLVAVTSVATGLAAYAMGRLKLGYLVRFVPFPVVSGFLAASGALLVRGAFDMVAPDLTGWTALAEQWVRWVPWFAAGLVILLVARRSSSGFVIPISLAVVLAGFFLVTRSLNLDMAALRDLGLLLGPFPGNSFVTDLGPQIVTGVDWPALLSQVPVILTVVGIALLGTLLNASGLELAIERDIDFERDLKGVGLANMVAGLAGGLVGYHLLSETFLARRFGVYGVAAGLGVAAAAAFALFFGAGVLAFLPIGLFAAVIWYLGFDLMLTAIRDHGRLMPRAELAIVLVMPVIALVFGFMTAVGFGISVAVLLFVVAYSGVDVTRLATTAANFHARVERAPQDHARLAELGDSVRIYRLTGFVFFGSASRLVDSIQRQVSQSPRPRYAILDLTHVVGLDMSAWAAFERLGRSCNQCGTLMVVTGLSPALAARFGRQGRAGSAHFQMNEDLDTMLMQIEDELLSGAGAGDTLPAELAVNLAPDTAGLLQKYGYWIKLAAGEELLAQGSRSDHMVFLLSGRLRASVTDRNRATKVVSRYLPGAIVGEIAYYAGVDRTATITAETEATAVRMDAAALDLMEQDDPAGAARFHRMLARVLAGRLMTTTRLLNDAEL